MLSYRRSPLTLDGVTDSYLACTKAPPRDVPKAFGLGLCGAPRNHGGPCQYAWNGGFATITTDTDPDPVTRAGQIESLYRRARAHHKVAMVCAWIQVAALAFTLSRVLWP